MLTARQSVGDTVLPGYPSAQHWGWVPTTGQHYLDVGQGAPLLFLHGNPSWSYLWRDLVRELAPRFRCVAPDHIGMGLSSRPEGDHPRTFEQRLDDMDHLYDHLVEQGLPEGGLTLVVHDWGGPLGLAWAQRRPTAVTRLVVLNSVGFRWPQGYRVPPYLTAIRDCRPVAAATHATNAFLRITVRVAVVNRLTSPERRAYLFPYRRRSERRAIVDFVRSIPAARDERLWLLVDPGGDSAFFRTLPVFVGWGMRDPVFTPAILAEWSRRFPHARIHRYDRAGHFVTEDAGRPLGADLLEFLTGPTS